MFKKPVIFHNQAVKIIRSFTKEVRKELGEALLLLQLGEELRFPISKSMPIIAKGVYELRFRDKTGIQRVFYYLKSERGLLVFHAYVKKTQNMPNSEVFTAKRRLQEMLDAQR